MTLHRLAALALVAAVPAMPCHAQAPAIDAAQWLATAQAHRFRDRVVALALIYGESSGIDPQGFKVEARQAGALVQGCADVDVVTSVQAAAVQRERLRVCKDREPPVR